MSSEEKIEDKTHIFNKEIRKYENILINFFKDIGEQKRTSPKITTILGYLFIHKSLTQRQLKDLTGFSRGSISAHLSAMVSLGVIEKNLISGTHKFSYSFVGRPEQLVSRGMKIFLETVSTAEHLCRKKKEELKELISLNKRGAEHLLERINELMDVFNIYREIFTTYEKI